MRSGLFGVSEESRSAKTVATTTTIEAHLCDVTVEIGTNSYDVNSVVAYDIKDELNI